MGMFGLLVQIEPWWLHAANGVKNVLFMEGLPCQVDYSTCVCSFPYNNNTKKAHNLTCIMGEKSQA